MSSSPVKVRFAPSPTGNLHLGATRTALFNWLYARSVSGKFLLRIEDTDQARSRSEYTRNILESLKWLGLTWDEEPWFQTQRFHRYKEIAGKLLERSQAYPCFCTPEELAKRREETEDPDHAYKYDRLCTDISPEEAQRRIDSGERYVLRFYIPEGTTVFNDVVWGQKEFDNNELDDFVILKSDGQPLYNFAVVVDDIDMKITHIIRGDDHISNTPKQVLIYQALGVKLPVFAHLPMILGPDKQKLSKRHGALSVLEYQNQGFIREAMINYLVLLGWSLDGETTYFNEEELISCFTLDRIRRSPSVFDEENLTSMNTKHILLLSLDERTRRIIPFLKQAGLIHEDNEPDFEWLKGIVSICKDRLKLLPDTILYTDFFFKDTIEYDEKSLKVLRKTNVTEYLTALKNSLAKLADFSIENIESAIRDLAGHFDIGAGKLIHPLRAAVTGKKIGPGLFETCHYLGQEKVVGRIAETLKMIPSLTPTTAPVSKPETV